MTEFVVTEQVLSGKADEVTERDVFLQAFTNNGKEEVDDERAPYLNLNGVFIISEEVFQWKVLFELFEEQFYLPALLVNESYLLRFHIHDIG